MSTLAVAGLQGDGLSIEEHALQRAVDVMDIDLQESSDNRTLLTDHLIAHQ